MMYKLSVAAAIFATASATLFQEELEAQNYLWENYKRDFNKAYATVEEDAKRLKFFLENLKTADLRNMAEIRNGGQAVHGITSLSDLSQEEFQSTYLKADVTQKSASAEVTVVSNTVNTSLGLVDWAGVFTTPVKNQGYCGSCWAFSATEQIESDAIRQLGQTFILSPEQITQCTTAAFGCGGGWTETAYAYVKTNGGITDEASYPYTSYYGTTGTCGVDRGDSRLKVGLSKFNTISGESDMAAYVQSTGPLSVCIDANNWNSYTGGILSTCGTSVDHCVQAVGVDASTGGYWKVRNSWGTSWGESGYIRLAYGQNTCAITNDPTYVEVFLK